MAMEHTDILHHYTKLNTLKCILENRTIRFSKLSEVNDKFEAETQDIGNLGKYIFVSCWSLYEKESIPMWNMYGDNLCGIRIGLNFPVFKLHHDRFGGFPDLFPPEMQVGEKYFIMPTQKNKLVNQVDYTDDSEKLKPKMKITFNQYLKGLDLGNTGLRKSTDWSYENEWRFILRTIPIPPNFKLDDDILQYFNEGVKLMEKKVDIGIDALYLSISDEVFDSMEITIGPKMNDNDREELNRLVNRYNSKARIVESSLKNKIR